MKRVLVVDDGGTIRLYHRTVLTEAGFTVEEAVNGMEGLEKAMQGEFDLLLVDVNMPKMDGFRMIAQLRREPAAWRVPVIMITTEHRDVDREQALIAGANLFLVKPVRPEELRAAACLMTGMEGL
ncbi:MAG: response regulator [Magnetococcales bacterium]|nr:response regulator [Magnetococcales bacterium]